MNTVNSIELFYLFFQGILLFQTFFLLVLYFITKKKDILYYSIFLLLSAAYFFLNAPNTFFGLNDDAIFNSNLYLLGNIPLIIIANLFYILFLKMFFAGVYRSKTLDKFFKVIFLLTPALIVTFFIFRYLNIDTQPIFYFVNLLAAGVSIFIISRVFHNRLHNTGWVAWGMVFNILGTALTILMIVLERYGIRNLITLEYPLIFMRIGILADMFFYQVALLKKWHFQEKQLAVEKLQSQLAVEKLRNKISGELHDDIGSTLSGVSMYSDIANEALQKGDNIEVKKSLSVIQQSTNQMVEKLGDLVWSTNSKQDSLPLVFERLQQYGFDMCKAKDILFKTNILIRDFDLPGENRFQLYLFCKEAINNTVKYSEASLLELIVKEKNTLLEITISDNGKGFDADAIKRGNGLDNMKKRAQELEADFDIQSTPGNGTKISVKLKMK